MKKKLIYGILLVLVLVGLVALYLFIRPSKRNDSTFQEDYPSVGEDHVFVTRTAEEIIRILKNGTGVVYLGFPECPWCQAYVKYLNEVAKEEKLDKIYYYNIQKDRANNTKEYQEMVSILEAWLQYDEEGNAKIYAPNVSFHVNGTIIGNDYETSKDTHGLSDPDAYWTGDNVKRLKETLRGYIKEVVAAEKMCTSCNR